MQQLSKQPAFELGQIVATPGALAALKKQDNSRAIPHAPCKPRVGDLSDEDRKENDYSLEHGFRLLSAYRTHAGESTLLSILGKFIPPDERILVIEDTAEIQLPQENLVRFEARGNRTAFRQWPFVTS